ncbi:hypothetical protein GSI_06571 [Ganoderma sinense ZZ0214-1]|uniref:Uncharacterized protein n=1 Tax=Ganoderma sinense ZZ0214-1 TaxID=1077348 RepID=A0A2G8SDS1_9APHY|nr:hypothetical protein GSI_06571 [Ganoderma sinense ZZ0214-1]
MPMASILAWRATCRDNHLRTTLHLRKSLDTLLARFVPDPAALLDYLARWGGLIIGEAALSHILHNPSICKSTLELAVGNLVFNTFVRRLTRLLPYGTHGVNLFEKPAPNAFPTLRHITRIAEFHLTSGLSVHVYESCSPSACDVVCGAWTTALMNFVTKSTFGCAYPRLTLNYCGILCDGRGEAKRWIDNCTHALLNASGFRFASSSDSWTLYSTGPYSTSVPIMVGCGRDLHVCPSQGRFFRDPGSLVVFFDGFFTNLRSLRLSYIAPYGPMTAWRIPTKPRSYCQCVMDSSVLPPLVVSIILHLVEDDYSSTPALAYVGSALPSPQNSVKQNVHHILRIRRYSF